MMRYRRMTIPAQAGIRDFIVSPVLTIFLHSAIVHRK
jgi:hypothetical protein